MRISDWSSDVCSSDLEKLTKFAEALEKANGQLQAATMWLMQNGMTNPNNAGAAAYSYMHIMGIVSVGLRSKEHTSELQSLMRNSYAVFCLKKKKYRTQENKTNSTNNNTRK